MGKKRQPITELELEIMRIIWKSGEVTVNDVSRELDKAGRPLAPPSIRTMLSILHDKGYVKRRPEGRGHAYRPVISAEEGRRRILKDVIQRAFDGSASSLVAALVKGDMVSRRELERVRRLIGERERGAKS